MRYQLDFGERLLDLNGNGIRAGVPPELAQALNDFIASFEAEQKIAFIAKVEEQYGKEYTLASVSVAALLTAYADEKKIGEQEQIRRFELARRLNRGGMQEFNDTERDLLKRLVGQCYVGNLVWPTFREMIERAERLPELAAVKA
jgi:hypothetical protein